MKSFLFFLMFVSINLSTHGQTQSNDTIYEPYLVDSLPTLFLNDAFVEIEDFLLQNIKWQKGMIEGERIVVSYIVDKEGNIQNYTILNSPQHCLICTEEFIRVFTSLPQLIPAKKGGINVSVRNICIFHFKIRR